MIVESEGAYWSVTRRTVPPVARDLVTTAEAARELGVSRRTLLRYVERGYLTPTVVLPSGHLRWDLDDLRQQLRALRERDE